MGPQNKARPHYLRPRGRDLRRVRADVHNTFMIFKRPIVPIMALIISFCMLGCGSLHHAQRVLIEHPKRVVQYPSQAGNFIGTVIGFPVGLILMFPAALIADMLPLDDETKAWAGLYPYVICIDTVTVIVGGLPWCAFGWRGVEKPMNEPGDEWLESLPRGAYVVTENGEMIAGRTSTNSIIGKNRKNEANGRESTGAPPAAGTPETHP